MPQSNLRFDAHCHVFGLEYLKIELPAIIRHLIRTKRITKIHLPSLMALIKPTDSHLHELWELIQWIKEILKAAAGTEETNINKVMDCAAKFLPGATRPNVRAITLMMDIFYMFDSALPQGATLAQADKETLASEAPEVESLYQEIATFLHLKTPTNALTTKYDFVCSPGLAHQLAHLPGIPQTYPFLAVDPRRPGMVAEVCKGKLVSKNGPFYGIKIYPRLGYHPECAELQPLYAFCNTNSLPITTHCGKIGFPIWHTSSEDWGHPQQFWGILQRFPNLRLNFAHFGLLRDNWDPAVFETMQKFANAYSDLACCTEKARLDFFHSQYYSHHEVRERTMFGTDFDVMFFTDLAVPMEKYYENFTKAFTAQELTILCSAVPQRFLGF